MELGLIDGNGTAIGDAVGTGVARLRRSDARSRRRSSSSPTATRTPARSAPEYAAHLAQTQGVQASTRCRSATATTSTCRTASTSSVSRSYVREHFPVNPELLEEAWRATTGGDSFVATDKKGLEQSMHADPRPAREDALRGAGGDDGRSLPVPPPARRRAPRARGARRASSSCGGSREVRLRPHRRCRTCSSRSACVLVVALFAGALVLASIRARRARRRASAIRSSSRSSRRSTPPGGAR